MRSLEIYPNQAVNKLGFNKIKENLTAYCISPLGLKYADRLRPVADYDFITKSIDQIEEFKMLHLNDEAFPLENLHALEDILIFLEINNSVLSENQFLMIRQFMENMDAMFIYFQKRPEKYLLLRQLLGTEPFDKSTLKLISSVISEEGEVRKGISAELDKIRKDIHGTERNLEKQFQSLLHFAQENNWISAGGESLRNGRRVLSLHAEHKRKIKGVIHDESATGKTVFVEPEQTLELNNTLFELKQQEKREIYKILKKLSESVRPSIPIIRVYQKTAGIFDFIRAKTLFALSLKCNKPEISKKQGIRLTKAYHPILFQNHSKQGKKVVPQSLELNKDQKILVISGPNAGGKSVSLKTVGLLQMMLQSGMQVPVNADSCFGIFNKIYVEIGDEQSIESDLSTYSSHLLNMRNLLAGADQRTLFLIDEFGTGTDPRFGGAIAESILQELVRKNCFGIITTHYSNLKVYATHHRGIQNGSMLFDMQTLEPLYVLKIGTPGSSHAFEIAKKIGLPAEVIENAEKKVDQNYQNFDALLATLETDKHLLDLKQKRLEVEQQSLDQLINSYTLLKTDLEKRKQDIILDNKQKALKELEVQRAKMDEIIKELRKKDKEKNIDLKLRQEITEQKAKLQEDIATIKEKKREKIIPKEVKIGSKVKLIEGEEIGVVEELRNKKALIAFRSMKSLVPIQDIEVVEVFSPKPTRQYGNIDYTNVNNSFSPTLDLRGKRTEEAISEVESQLDKALLLNYPSLRIVHGKGNGILRKMIRETLAKYDFIDSYSSETEEFGGEGVTIVQLK